MRNKNTSLLISIAVLFCFMAINSAQAVTREEMIAMAENYASYEWTPTEKNVCHKITVEDGCCAKYNAKWECIKKVDCRIDTPDRNTNTTWDEDRGWKWGKINGEYMGNTSVPYNWGGFSSLGEFNEGIENDLCAGNKYTFGGRQAGTVGVDCSGFVSRAWDLKRKESTRTLPNISRELKEYDGLQKGDILNIKNNHVMLHNRFLDSGSPHVDLEVYESQGYYWKVKTSKYNIIDELQRDKYLPYTYFKSMDVDIVIDRSGSMSWIDMFNAKNAAKQFVDFMKKGDKVGVVSFSSSARVDYQLNTIDSNNPSVTKTNAKEAIGSINAGGMTSIGAGLQIGQDQLNDYGEERTLRAMILISDGYENTYPYVRDILPEIINDGIKVCTIGLGFGSDIELLRDIASQTGCVYKFAADSSALQEIYQDLWSQISGEQTIKKIKQKIDPEEIITKFAQVDSALNSATFTVSWAGSDVDLTLFQPDGIIIDHTTNNPGIEFIEGNTYEFYRIEKPMNGQWQLEFYGKNIPPGGENFVFSLSGESGLIFNVNLNKEEYYQGDGIIISASVEDPVLDIDLPQYAREMNFEVEVENPNQTVSSFSLFDDSLHNDGEANDGIFASVFSETYFEGNYNFTIKASGRTNGENEIFAREKNISVIVLENPLLIVTAEANGPYFGFVGLPVTFDANGSHSSSGQALEYRWDFNSDGIFDTDFMAESSVERTFWSPFTGIATLEVSAGGVSATDIAEVNIRGAIELKRESVSDLKAMVFSENSNFNKIENAIKHINKSLEEDLWLDDSRLKSEKSVGAVVFDMEKAAVSELEAIKTDNANIKERIENIISKLVKTDEILAAVSIKEAEDFVENIYDLPERKITEKKLEKAMENMEEAREYYSNQKPAKAINSFKLVWNFSQGVK